jgi:hypothetical protein
MGMSTQGYQEVSLQKDGCVYKGIILHEVWTMETDGQNSGL